MNDNTQLSLAFLILAFAVMFIAHTISDYNSLTTALDYCKPKIEGVKHD